jgi:hypothetical protein
MEPAASVDDGYDASDGENESAANAEAVAARPRHIASGATLPKKIRIIRASGNAAAR